MDEPISMRHAEAVVRCVGSLALFFAHLIE